MICFSSHAFVFATRCRGKEVRNAILNMSRLLHSRHHFWIITRPDCNTDGKNTAVVQSITRRFILWGEAFRNVRENQSAIELEVEAKKGVFTYCTSTSAVLLFYCQIAVHSLAERQCLRGIPDPN